MLLTIFSVWLHNATAQYEAGVDQYYTLGDHKVAVMPVCWYESEKGWSGEMRYNYEEEGAVSLYAGKTIEKDAAVYCSMSALAGVVMGKYQGGSFLLNGDIGYKKVLFSLQSQYTFSVQNHCKNFFYSWTDVSYRASPFLSAGVSLQQTRQFETDMYWQPGFFARAHFGNWAFPLYVFSSARSSSTFIMGMSFNWRKQRVNKMPSLVKN